MKLTFAPLQPAMRRVAFACGDASLDAYLQRQAGQDMKRGFATVIVARNNTEPDSIVGYYTLSTASIVLDALPDSVARKMPRYPSVPAVRLGRLAVAADCQGQHIGSLLLLDALRRACANELAWAIFLVDAKNDRVATFYERFLFQRFMHSPLSLWMHRKQAEALTP